MPGSLCVPAAPVNNVQIADFILIFVFKSGVKPLVSCCFVKEGNERFTCKNISAALPDPCGLHCVDRHRIGAETVAAVKSLNPFEVVASIVASASINPPLCRLSNECLTGNIRKTEACPEHFHVIGHTHDSITEKRVNGLEEYILKHSAE